MASSSPIDDFLDRARKVFSLAGDLGRAFSEEHRRQRQVGQIDPSSWDRHATLFQEFGDGMLGLQDVMQNPLAGVEHVTEQLLNAAGIAEQIWDTIEQPHGRDEATYLDFFPRLNSLFEDGWRAVEGATKAQRSSNPFSRIKDRLTTNQSDIDTTPAYPEPPSSAIDSAARDIPDIMSNVKLGNDRAIELVASHLAKRMQDAGHTLAAAHWAIHRSILAGRLVPGRIEDSAPTVGKTVGGAMRNWGGRDDRRTVWSGGGTGPKNIPKGKPVPFDHFKVTATEALWTWWRSIAAKPASNRESAEGVATKRNSDPAGSSISGSELQTSTPVPAMVDVSSTIIRGAIETARRAWFDGHALIVDQINAVLMEKKTGLQIASTNAPPGTTVLDCRRRLARAFRDIPLNVSELPDADDDRWSPWSVGYINDRTNPPFSVGANRISSMPEGVAQIMEFLRQKTMDWPWRDNLVVPIEEDAIQATRAFDAMLGRVASIYRQAVAAAPKVELLGPQPPNLFHWKGKTCELTSKPWSLVKLLWGSRSMPEDDVFEQVWPDVDRSTSALKSAINRANEALADDGIPVLLSRKNGFVTLSISDSA